MARKRKPEHVNHERWLVSYADFITLLFAFFVVLYASSQSDKGKMAELAAAIQQAFSEMGPFSGQTIGPPVKQPSAAQPSVKPEISAATQPELVQPLSSSSKSRISGERRDLETLRRELESALDEELRKKKVALSIGPEGMVISLREVGFFHSGSAAVRTDAVAAFGRIAVLLRDRGCHVRLEGHTDNVPIHTSQFNSNWELSTARATSLVRDLITKHGFQADKLSAAGFAEFHPVVSNASSEGRSQNRRVDLVILEPCGASQQHASAPPSVSPAS